MEYIETRSKSTGFSERLIRLLVAKENVILPVFSDSTAKTKTWRNGEGAMAKAQWREIVKYIQYLAISDIVGKLGGEFFLIESFLLTFHLFVE